jgi:L-threonine 3-dehydrogenase (EC 1.1.1.103)
MLVVGAAGQIGSELVPKLREKYGNDNVVATFHRVKKKFAEPVEALDVLDRNRLEEIIDRYDIDTVFI